MSKWVKFGRRFNFIPKKKAAVTLQYSAGDVDDVTNECAERAINAGAAVEIEAPSNSDEAAKLRSGEVEAVPVKVKPEAPAAAPAAAPAKTKS